MPIAACCWGDALSVITRNGSARSASRLAIIDYPTCTRCLNVIRPQDLTCKGTAMNDDSDLPLLLQTRIGRYRHYKGMQYEVLATVRHSETRESMTLYRALYGEQGLWVRPSAMFNEDIEVAGLRQPRFEWMPD